MFNPKLEAKYFLDIYNGYRTIDNGFIMLCLCFLWYFMFSNTEKFGKYATFKFYCKLCCLHILLHFYPTFINSQKSYFI